jgi:putative protein kinase ArgK-like GTPase of G3E family
MASHPLSAENGLAVVITGPPGAGKSVTLPALSDAPVADRVAHAAVD